ncbi:MAG: hypothetical protein CM1200mP10_20160 [Candidatus Neomarinimicrobiota bacterium]|nr:MAG: hypothetical protein CM1200mP10_20160 [Candidatus Neomarinimicrobiota bacterium]
MAIRKSPGEVEYSVLPEGIKESSPYLNLQSGQVINQKLDGKFVLGKYFTRGIPW